MSNLLDYITWRGDLSLAADGWNDFDTLAAACLSYLNAAAVPGETVALPALAEVLPEPDKEGITFGHSCWELLQAMAKAPRYAELRICRFVDEYDPENALQFSAMTLVTPGAPAIVAFRGTDGTLAGWKEDFDMSYEAPVPAQALATDYLNAAAAALEGTLIVTGHSKGGNLAAYASAHAEEAVRGRLTRICCFDSPGVDPDTAASEAFRALLPRMVSCIPQSSIVGLLLSNDLPHTIIRSTAVSILQHDPFTWVLNGPRYETVEETTRSSQLIDTTMDQWLAKASREERHAFVDTLFSLLQSAGATTTAELAANGLKTLRAAIQLYGKGMDAETRKAFAEMAGRMISLGMENFRVMSGNVLREELERRNQEGQEQARRIAEEAGKKLGEMLKLPQRNAGGEPS